MAPALLEVVGERVLVDPRIHQNDGTGPPGTQRQVWPGTDARWPGTGGDGQQRHAAGQDGEPASCCLSLIQRARPAALDW